MNKKLLRNSSFIFATLLFAGCATLYQPEGFFTNGYTSQQIASDRFVITFRANEHTDPERVREYALQRASEVAAEHGFKSYVILEEYDSSKRGQNGPRPKHLRYPSIRLVIQGIH